jgi:hypothetical protein
MRSEISGIGQMDPGIIEGKADLRDDLTDNQIKKDSD